MRKWLPLILALALCLVGTVALAECDHFDEKLVPNADGTHSHVCTVCGEDNGKEECADSCDDGDSACDWCGSTYVEADNYHFDDPTCKVEDGKHVVTCGCGVVVGTYEPIAMDNGDKLFHDMGCWYCFGANGTPEFHTGLGSGTYIDEATCSFTCADCGYTHEGSHNVAMGGGEGFHGASCYYCGYWTEKEDCYEECYGSDGACDICGGPVAADMVRHDYYDLTPCVVSDGKHVRTCISCEEATLELEIIYREYDEMFHVQGCHYCVRNGLASAEQMFHSGAGACIDEENCSFTCEDCGYTHEGAHKTMGLSVGDGFHGTDCMYCGYWTWQEDCAEDCSDQDGECDTCGEPVVVILHADTTNTIEGDVCNHVCNGCGETVPYELEWIPHESQPTGLTGHFSSCPECWKTGVSEQPHTYEYTTTADNHRGECTVCGWAEDQEAHVYTDDDDLDCDVCGLVRNCEHDGDTVCTANGSKHDVACARCGEALKSVELTWVSAETGHCSKCDVCGETSAEEAHEIAYSYNNDTHTAKCGVCGYEAAAEAHVYTDEEDNDCDVCGKTKQCQHTYWFNIWPAPTCTESGTRTEYCNLCGKVHSTSTVPAKGHDLSTEDMGDYLLETCSRCDYENRIDKQVEEQPAAPVVNDGLLVNDVDMAAETAVELPENVTAAKVFTVAYMQAGEAVQPETAMTVTLPLTEEELSALEGLKLVLILEDGTMVEVAYEVVDGQIVFTATQMGTFAFIAE